MLHSWEIIGKILDEYKTSVYEESVSEIEPERKEFLEQVNIILHPVDNDVENEDTLESFSLRDRMDALLILEDFIYENEDFRREFENIVRDEYKHLLRIALEDMPKAFGQRKMMQRFILFLIIMIPPVYISSFTKVQLKQLRKTNKYVNNLSDFDDFNYGPNYQRWNALMKKISSRSPRKSPQRRFNYRGRA
tara:strand:- start:169 stop:744 length:576 start_codon:yes stop_codon:yes gene_type:complete